MCQTFLLSYAATVTQDERSRGERPVLPGESSSDGGQRVLEAKTGDQRGHDFSVLPEAQNRSIGPVAVVGIGCWFASVEGCLEAKF
jgi:hypothetical protein